MLNSNLLSNITKHDHFKKVTIIELWLFFVFLSFLFVTRYSYHLLFHTSAEIFACMMSFGLFVIALNTNRMSENNFIVFLGIGYLFIGAVDMFHIFIYKEVSIIFKEGSQSIVVQFWIAARYMSAITFLISTLLLYKPVKQFRTLTIFFSYFFSTVLIIASILYFKIFPACYVYGQGLTQFKIISEYIISVVLLLVAVLYFNLRKKIDNKLFFYIECHLITMIVSEILFTSFFSPHDWTNVWSHIIRVISYFFLYKAIIETGLKRPYAILFHKIDKIDYELHITSNKLKQEERQRRMMEEMLAKSNQCYELIINNSSDAITVASEDKFIFANDRAVKIFGVENTRDLIGMNSLSFVHSEERANVSQHIERLRSKLETPTLIEYKIVSLTGEVIDVEVIIDYLLYQGKLSYMSIFRDISQRKQISKLKNDIRNNEKELIQTKEYNKMLTEFFTNISHELKTPLNVILGAIQVLSLPDNHVQSYHLDTILYRYLRVMKQNCSRLLRLVNNLIDLSKFDSGYLKLNLSNQNIINIVEDISMSVADYIESCGLTIVFDTDVEEKVIAVDIDKIERIMLNLLSNSIKFTDKGGRIFIDMRDMNDRVAISVKDTGIGIPKDKLRIIFDRFGQVDKTLSRHREGSGIGLSLVKTIVEMHGGTIKISSVEGEGTEITIELPVQIVEDEIASDNLVIHRSNVEKINVEFSDIYL